MLLNELFKQYLYYTEINKSKGTLGAEHDALSRFLKYCQNNNINESNEINTNNLIEFVKYCKSKNNCNKTINKSIQSTRRAFNYLKINNDDLFGYKLLIEEKKHFDFLTDYKINKLINYLDALNDSGTDLRNKVIIYLLLDTGSRISELLSIKIKNISLKYNSILLEHTKQHRERYVFFTDHTKKILKKYIKEQCIIEKKYLFFNQKSNTIMVYSSVINIFNKIKNECNFKQFHPHLLRHTNATILATGGLNEFDLMTLLGHSSPETTKIYIHNNQKMLSKKFDIAFKKGNLDNHYNK